MTVCGVVGQYLLSSDAARCGRAARDAVLREFPAVSEEVRKLALESGGYDLERTRTVLENMVERGGATGATVTDTAPATHTRSAACSTPNVCRSAAGTAAERQTVLSTARS